MLSSVQTYSLRQHSHLASLCASGTSSADIEHRVERPREQFNCSVPDSKAVADSLSTLMETPPKQASSSAVLEDLDQAALWDASPPTTRSKRLAETAPGTSDWLKVTPSPGLGLRLSPDEAQVLFNWWLGLPLFQDSATCPLCGPQEPLDKLGHHATTCKRGPHVCCHHNVL